jgi:two-component system, sensor histidine kinase and response regulator
MQQIFYILQKAKVSVSCAINGLEALEAIQAQSRDQKFDFIILDLNMPILDGYEAAKKIIDHYEEHDKLVSLSNSVNLGE